MSTVFKILLMVAAALPVPTWAACDIQSDELRVTLSGQAALVNAKINDTDVALLVDSGSTFNVLLPAMADQLSLTRWPLPQSMNVVGVGGLADAHVARVARFQLKKATLPNVAFVVTESALPGIAKGILGQSLLSFADVEYDMAHGMVRIMSPHGDCGSENLAYWADGQPVVTLDLERGWPMTISTAYVNGARMRVLFDTGANASVLSLAAARRAGLEPDGQGVVPAGTSAGVGRHSRQTWTAPVKLFTIGNEQIHDVRLGVFQMESQNIDMLLGMDFFLAHRIYVANGQRKVYLTYNGGPVFHLPVSAVMTEGKAPAQ